MKILIIGATSAIAQACARLWSAQGAEIFIVGRDTQKLELVAGDLELRGASQVQSYRLDVNDVAAHEPMLLAAITALGQLDIALIAHGTLPDQRNCETDPQLALREFATNCGSTIALLTALAARFEQQRKGALAVITSVAGDRGRPTNYLYGSAKAAVSVFCEGLRSRLFKHGVSVTDIRPGFVDTPMTRGLSLPGALVSQPERVARKIVSGVAKGKAVLYTPAYWRMIMWVIRSIPRAIFNRLTL